MDITEIRKHAIEMARNADSVTDDLALEYRLEISMGYDKVVGRYIFNNDPTESIWLDTGITTNDAEAELQMLEHLRDIHEPVELPEYFF